jgi:hypothetical protein
LTFLPQPPKYWDYKAHIRMLGFLTSLGRPNLPLDLDPFSEHAVPLSHFYLLSENASTPAWLYAIGPKIW